MSGVSLPVTRPAGRALIVGGEASRAEPANLLRQQGFVCEEADDPYAAMVALCQPGSTYKALVLSLTGLYREELQMIASVKRRFPGVEIWMTHADGRLAALAEAMRCGADGLLSEDGFHRTTAAPQVTETSESETEQQGSPPLTSSISPPLAGPEEERSDDRDCDDSGDDVTGEPVLSAEELRALLQEQPALPPSEER